MVNDVWLGSLPAVVATLQVEYELLCVVLTRKKILGSAANVALCTRCASNTAFAF